jgi:hypothetical protein
MGDVLGQTTLKIAAYLAEIKALVKALWVALGTQTLAEVTETQPIVTMLPLVLGVIRIVQISTAIKPLAKARQVALGITLVVTHLTALIRELAKATLVVLGTAEIALATVNMTLLALENMEEVAEGTIQIAQEIMIPILAQELTELNATRILTVKEAPQLAPATLLAKELVWLKQVVFGNWNQPFILWARFLSRVYPRQLQG